MSYGLPFKWGFIKYKIRLEGNKYGAGSLFWYMTPIFHWARTANRFTYSLLIIIQIENQFYFRRNILREDLLDIISICAIEVCVHSIDWPCRKVSLIQIDDSFHWENWTITYAFRCLATLWAVISSGRLPTFAFDRRCVNEKKKKKHELKGFSVIQSHRVAKYRFQLKRKKNHQRHTSDWHTFRNILRQGLWMFDAFRWRIYII